MSKLIRVLSIDGGGMKGILPGQVLVYLERQIKKRTKNSEAKLADYFDFVAGTSTGGILTCTLLTPDENGKPKYSAEEVVGFYSEKGEDVFKSTFRHKISSLGGLNDEKYSAKGMEKVLHDYFGDTQLKDLLKPCLITSYDIERRKAHFFRQHEAKTDGYNNFLVKDVARSTSAAPTYFEPALVQSFAKNEYALIDGGMFANNPSMCAYAEVRDSIVCPRDSTKKASAQDMLFVSIGTGDSEQPFLFKDAKDWGVTSWIKPIIDILMSGVSETVDYQLKKIFDATDSNGQYIRINMNLPESVSPEMDDASPENIKMLNLAGEEMVRQNLDKLDKVLDYLLA